MNDNYPPGAANDPNAPWNDDFDQEKFEETIDEAIEEVRGELAEQLPDLLYSLISEYLSGDAKLVAYDILFDEAKRLWEN